MINWYFVRYLNLDKSILNHYFYLKQKEEYYEKLKANKKRLEDKELLDIAEECALNAINRELSNLDSEKFFEEVANNNGHIPKEDGFSRFIAK